MAHVTGNNTWQDWPNTSTLITATALENIELRLDKTATQYSLTMPTAYVNVTAAYNAPAQVGSTLNIPDPGCPYVLSIAGMVVTRTGTSANQRTDLSLRVGSAAGTELVHVAGNPALPASTFIQVAVAGSWPRVATLTGPISLVLAAGVFPNGATGQVGGQNGFDPGNFVTVTVIPA